VFSPRCRLIQLEWIYSVFTMRTLYTLFALISLVLVALVAAAAPPNPTLSIDCTSPCQTGNFTLTASGVNPHKSYAVWTVGDGNLDSQDALIVGPDGSVSLPVILFPGSYTFTLYLLDHTGDVFNPKTALGTLDVDIQ
jgi:hypothetical protein